MTKISIIMPVFNASKLINKSLASILSQSIEDIEIICIDDGSTDDTLNVLKNYANQYDFIKVLTQENQGSGKARNYGIKEASGDYIGFLDADDFFISNTAFEKLYETAIENDALIVSGNIKLVDYEGNFSPFHPLEYYTEYKKILPEEYGIPWSFYKNIYKREFLIENNIEFPDLIRGQDPVFLAKALSLTDANTLYMYCGWLKYLHKRYDLLLYGIWTLLSNIDLPTFSSVSSIGTSFTELFPFTNSVMGGAVILAIL